MINKELAEKIWSAYNEIEKTEKLKKDVEDSILAAKKEDKDYQLKNIFGEGRRCHLS